MEATNHFALIEGQLLPAMMVQQYHVTESPKQSDAGKMAITMHPKYVLHVRKSYTSEI